MRACSQACFKCPAQLARVHILTRLTPAQVARSPRFRFFSCSHLASEQRVPELPRRRPLVRSSSPAPSTARFRVRSSSIRRCLARSRLRSCPPHYSRFHRSQHFVLAPVLYFRSSPLQSQHQHARQPHQHSQLHQHPNTCQQHQHQLNQGETHALRCAALRCAVALNKMPLARCKMPAADRKSCGEKAHWTGGARRVSKTMRDAFMLECAGGGGGGDA